MAENYGRKKIEFDAEEVLRKILFDRMRQSPQVGDTMTVNPGTDQEIKYKIIFVGKERQNIMKNDDRGNYAGAKSEVMDVVKYECTHGGQTVEYTRTVDQWREKIMDTSSMYVSTYSEESKVDPIVYTPKWIT